MVPNEERKMRVTNEEFENHLVEMGIHLECLIIDKLWQLSVICCLGQLVEWVASLLFGWDRPLTAILGSSPFTSLMICSAFIVALSVYVVEKRNRG
jgi:3-hydroxymyristoyl/3-hydroxydecanoyl-(acyl carrier protein) dehydratase